MNISIKNETVVAYLQQFINTTDFMNEDGFYSDVKDTSIVIKSIVSTDATHGHVTFKCKLDSKWNGVDTIQLILGVKNVCGFVHSNIHKKNVMTARYNEAPNGKGAFFVLFQPKGLFVLPIIDITDVSVGIDAIVFEAVEEPVDKSMEEKGE